MLLIQSILKFSDRFFLIASFWSSPSLFPWTSPLIFPFSVVPQTHYFMTLLASCSGCYTKSYSKVFWLLHWYHFSSTVWSLNRFWNLEISNIVLLRWEIYTSSTSEYRRRYSCFCLTPLSLALPMLPPHLHPAEPEKSIGSSINFTYFVSEAGVTSFFLAVW